MRLDKGDASVVAGGDNVSVRQTRIGKRIVGIGRDCLLEQINALLEALRRPPIPGLPPLEIKTIGLRIRRPGATEALPFISAQLDSQTAGNVAGDVTLHLRNVR